MYAPFPVVPDRRLITVTVENELAMMPRDYLLIKNNIGFG